MPRLFLRESRSGGLPANERAADQIAKHIGDLRDGRRTTGQAWLPYLCQVRENRALPDRLLLASLTEPIGHFDQYLHRLGRKAHAG